MAEKQVDFQVILTGRLIVDAETTEEAAEMVKGLVGASVSTAIAIHPVNTKIDMQVSSVTGLVTANGPVPINRAQRRAAGRGK